MYYIIQVCCLDCKYFTNFKICYDKDYFNFLKNNFDDYQDFFYYIYDSGGNLVKIIEYDDLVG